MALPMSRWTFRIAAVAEHVDVVAKSPVSDAGTLATTDTVAASGKLKCWRQAKDSRRALRLLSGVIQVPGGESIDGGRPNQAGVQLGSATLLDSATNLARVSLPLTASTRCRSYAESLLKWSSEDSHPVWF